MEAPVKKIIKPRKVHEEVEGASAAVEVAKEAAQPEEVKVVVKEAAKPIVQV